LKIKKIGIITFHFATNCGGVLQAFSLLDTLKKLNNTDVSIIDFRPEELTKNFEVYLYKRGINVAKLLLNLLTYNIRKNKKIKFQSFEKDFLSLSSFEKNDFDILVSGSDQVWNPSITKLKEYYLNIETGAKKVSYAASIGKDTLDKEEINFLQDNLKSIDTFSLREDSAVKIIKKLFPKKDVEQVLDPVFLKTKEEWKKLITPTPLYGNYILIYVMEFNKKLIDLAKKLSNETNNNIIFISPNVSIKTVIKSIKIPGKVLFDVGPLDYLNLIYNANYICTNSFHGSAFSIIFQKKFITVPHSSRNTRLKSILTALGITSQEINSQELSKKDNISDIFEYDIEMVSNKLDTLRDESIKFLEKAIG
jgi:hypothetical protein